MKLPPDTVPSEDDDWDSFLASLDAELGTPVPAAPQPKPRPKQQPAAPRSVQTAPKKKKKKKKSGALRRFLVIAAVLVLLVGIAGVGVTVLLPMLDGMGDPYGGKMLDGTAFGNIPLGGLSKAQAAKAIEAVYGRVGKEDTVIQLPDSKLALSPKDSGISMDIDRIVADAYACGRQDASAVQAPAQYLSIDETAVRAALTGFAAKYDALYTPTSYSLEGSIPALDEGSFNENAPLPTLLLTTGTPGVEMDIDAVYDRIVAACLAGSTQVDATDQLQEKKSEAIDLDAIATQVGILPVDASLDSATKTAIPGAYGLDVNREEAQAAIAKAGSGETLRIPMTYVAPQILGQDVYFQDVLGFCQTPHSNNEKRNTNLRLACASLNGVVLQPGDVLSYNDTLGQRTAENGYQSAPAYSGTELVDSLGGGICQVSSTLYLCSLYAGLETVERINHGFPVAYIPIGLDATVSWGSPDLKIRNDSDYPVRIVAEEQDGFVRIWIMGTETRNYYIRMAYSSGSDRYARNYIIKYDRQTNEQIERIDNAWSAYMNDIESLRGEIGSEQAYVNGMPRDQEPCSPTPEALEAARRNIAPNAHASNS